MNKELKRLTPLAKKLMEICPTRKDYVEVLTLIDAGLREHILQQKERINEASMAFYQECLKGNNMTEWEKAYDDYHSKVGR